jgi:hypothetical protein
MQTRRRLKSGSESGNFAITVEEEKPKEKSIPTWAKKFANKFANKISDISDNLNPYSYILNPNHFQPVNISADSNSTRQTTPETRPQSDNNLELKQPIVEDFYKTEEEPLFVMTARDRTQEFSSAIRSLQGRNTSIAVNLKDPKKVKQFQNYSEFMMVAKHIGKNIASTFAKLEKLTLRMFHKIHEILNI